MCMLSVNVYSQDESLYLDSLDAEANGLRLDRNTQMSVDAPALKTVDAAIKVSDEENAGGAGTNLRDKLSFQQFGRVLKDNFMGSFYYYKQLNGQQKFEVYSTYQRHPELDLIRESILKEFKNI